MTSKMELGQGGGGKKRNGIAERGGLVWNEMVMIKVDGGFGKERHGSGDAGV